MLIACIALPRRRDDLLPPVLAMPDAGPPFPPHVSGCPSASTLSKVLSAFNLLHVLDCPVISSVGPARESTRARKRSNVLLYLSLLAYVILHRYSSIAPFLPFRG